ncbi:MAG: thioredoxin [Deltaproteobacteria bacterium HGW-Deltaproteobacteria-10]|nr:MAG: thioredoxin [Deltaproteobacteria bacterium HGW-Deltaproteobacteria-10]
MNNQYITDATDDNFDAEVLKSSKPVLVDFWAPWCGPCKAVSPIVEELAQQYKDSIKVMKLNVDDSQKSALNYGVRSIPTIILFKDGKILDSIIGLVPKDRLENFIKKGL